MTGLRLPVRNGTTPHTGLLPRGSFSAGSFVIRLQLHTGCRAHRWFAYALRYGYTHAPQRPVCCRFMWLHCLRSRDTALRVWVGSGLLRFFVPVLPAGRAPLPVLVVYARHLFAVVATPTHSFTRLHFFLPGPRLPLTCNTHHWSPTPLQHFADYYAYPHLPARCAATAPFTSHTCLVVLLRFCYLLLLRYLYASARYYHTTPAAPSPVLRFSRCHDNGEGNDNMPFRTFSFAVSSTVLHTAGSPPR